MNVHASGLHKFQCLGMEIVFWFFFVEKKKTLFNFIKYLPFHLNNPYTENHVFQTKVRTTTALIVVLELFHLFDCTVFKCYYNRSD